MIAAVLLAVLGCFVCVNEALIHDLEISDDSRATFFIENFGFLAGGHLVVNVTGFKVSL
jgi:hypothetical protein